MVEVAISLAIIGIALVAIIGVLPLGMNVQRDNREGTIINQDATVFLDAISKGARGLDDLTNYVYAVTNYWTQYDNKGLVVNGGGSINNGYSFTNSSTVTALTPKDSSFPINNGTNIIGLLSTPQFTDVNGLPVSDLFSGGFSNHIVAYVRSMSGSAGEKPPQDNQIIQADAFGYRLLCVNAAVANYTPPFWLAQSYNAGAFVSFTLNNQTTYWQAKATTSPTDVPDSSSLWVQNVYWQKLAANLHELRLTFLWPTLPNGGVGSGRQSYRTTVAGQIVITNNLYFFQSQSFTNAP
jgi:type II secretory pathway pseudopilin PulG